jgi:hypothetical protein
MVVAIQRQEITCWEGEIVKVANPCSSWCNRNPSVPIADKSRNPVCSASRTKHSVGQLSHRALTFTNANAIEGSTAGAFPGNGCGVRTSKDCNRVRIPCLGEPGNTQRIRVSRSRRRYSNDSRPHLHARLNHVLRLAGTLVQVEDCHAVAMLAKDGGDVAQSKGR